MKEEYMTQTEALTFLGMHQNTFKLNAQRLSIKGVRNGRCTMYLRSDIERINNMFSERVPYLINQLEYITQCKVTLTPNN